MKEYPSIGKDVRNGEKIYAFDKLDGNNIRAEWGRWKGKWGEFWKFGTKTQMLDKSDPDRGEAVQLIVDKYQESLTEIFRKQRWEKVICFFEYYGANSFAGRHVKEEPHTVTLFDVSVHKKGILLPQDFLKLFDKLEVAKLLYYGNANSEFIEKVKNRQLEGMTFEGVVCKGAYETPGMPLMFKIKSLEWLERLKKYCNGDDSLFKQLA
jgi:hypothetical protein